MSVEHIEFRAEITSNCCNAPIWRGDICSQCKEHCGGQKECNCCDNGKVFRDTVPSSNYMRAVNCRNCEGEGYIEVEL